MGRPLSWIFLCEPAIDWEGDRGSDVGASGVFFRGQKGLSASGEIEPFFVASCGRTGDKVDAAPC